MMTFPWRIVCFCPWCPWLIEMPGVLGQNPQEVSALAERTRQAHVIVTHPERREHRRAGR